MNPTPTVRTQASVFQHFFSAQSSQPILTDDAPTFIDLYHEMGIRLHVPVEVFPFIAPGDHILVTLGCVKAVLGTPDPLEGVPLGIPLLGGPKIIGGK